MRTSCAALLGALVAASAPGIASAQTAGTPDPRPNVVVIMTDDQDARSLRVMKEVDRRLRERGATFANSFVALAQCCPSRATFLTGQYAHNHGVLGNEPPDGGYTKLDHTNTLAVWLQEAGYNTIHIGKYLNGYGLLDPTEIPPGWTEWRGSVDPSTYRYFGYTLNENGKLATYDHTYQTDLYARKATNVIRRRGPQAAPFFLWIAFLAPHSGKPRDADDPRGLGTPAPAPRHRDAFATKDLPRPPSFNEADVSDKPFDIRRRSLLGPARIRKVQENYQQRLESLLAVDEAVAKVVGALREAGELANTLIVFTSDNGFFHGEHRVEAGKLLLYEPSIRVPLVMRGPGIPAGLRLTQHVSNIDLAPTIAEAASATPGRAMDGLSLLPLFTDSTASLERDLLVERLTGDFVFAALRTRGYLYAEHGNGERELYDFARDRHQLESKHADPAYAAIQADLAARLDRLRTCAAETCRTRP